VLHTLTAAALLFSAAPAPSAGTPPPPAAGPLGATVSAAPLPTIPLGALVASGPRGLEPSARAHALAGQRVRLVGHMAHLEEAPGGAFYLAARPVECDEGGGGNADLPPEAVRVVVRSAAGTPVRWLPGPIEVTGRFEVGGEADADGQVAWFRLILDRLEDLAAAPAATPTTTAVTLSP
jgi:hypothetical protein